MHQYVLQCHIHTHIYTLMAQFKSKLVIIIHIYIYTLLIRDPLIRRWPNLPPKWPNSACLLHQRQGLYPTLCHGYFKSCSCTKVFIYGKPIREKYHLNDSLLCCHLRQLPLFLHCQDYLIIVTGTKLQLNHFFVLQNCSVTICNSIRLISASLFTAQSKKLFVHLPYDLDVFHNLIDSFLTNVTLSH